MQQHYGIMSHYMPLITPHPVVTWQDVLLGAEAGEPLARHHCLDVHAAEFRRFKVAQFVQRMPAVADSASPVLLEGSRSLRMS